MPPRFSEARDAVRSGIAQAAATGIADSTMLAVLMSETLPRLVNGLQAGAIMRSEGRGFWWCMIPLDQWPRQPEWRQMPKSYWNDA